MNFKQKKNKSLHLAHLESGYLCFFQVGPSNPAITEANNIVPFARKATEEVITETIEQTAVQTGTTVIGAGAKTIGGKVLGPAGIVYDVLGNAEPTDIGPFGAAPENTFDFLNNINAKTLKIALNSSKEPRLQLNGNVFLPTQYSLVELAPDVKIGFNGKNYILYKQGQETQLALGDEITKKGDVLEIKTGGETIKIPLSVGFKKPDDSKTKLANGGDSATPTLEQQKQEDKQQEAINGLNKSNAGSRAVYSGGGEDGGDIYADHNPDDYLLYGLGDPYNYGDSSYQTWTSPPSTNDEESSPYDLDFSTPEDPFSVVGNYGLTGKKTPEFSIKSLSDGTQVLSFVNPPENGTIVNRFNGVEIKVENNIPSQLILKQGDKLTLPDGTIYLVNGSLKLIEQAPEPISETGENALTEAAKNWAADW